MEEYKTVYGYPIEDVIRFGVLVKESGLEPWELAQIMRDTEKYYELLDKLFKESIKRVYENL